MKKTLIKHFSQVLGFFFVAASFVACDQKGTETIEEEGTRGIVLEDMDTTVSPGDDFFKYVNGSWIANTEIPGDQGRWGSFNELREYNNDVVLDVLKTAAASDKYAEGSDQRKVADFYASGMDSLLAEKVKLTPLQPFIDQIYAIENASDLQKYLAQQEVYGGGSFFGFAIFPDLTNSEVMASYLAQGGLGLPDRDYYTKTDEKSKETREKYVKHVARMLQLAGQSESDATANADAIMKMETQMAEASMTNVEQRDIPKMYNKRSLAELTEMAPSFDWGTYFNDLGASGIDTVIVMQPKFVAEVDKMVNEYPMTDIQNYLFWGLINGTSNFLHNEIVQANFDFYGKELRGTEEMRPRWKRVLGMTNGALGEAIGKLYVDETFPPEAKASAQEMVENIRSAFGDRIQNLDWMSADTKEKALKKLSTFTVKIGYPDEWRDYSDLDVGKGPESGSYIQNVMNAAKFGFEYQLNKLGKPVDKKEWGMNPQTVNAYYNPLFNEIVFPAGILQPPFYDYKADEAVKLWWYWCSNWP